MVVPQRQYHTLTAWLCTALVFSCLVAIIDGQLLASSIQSPCINNELCHTCIQTPNCGWCMNPGLSDKPRCMDPSKSKEVCGPEAFFYNPRTEQKLLSNYELTRKSFASGSSGGQMMHGVSFAGSSSHNSSYSSSHSESYGSSSAGSSGSAFSGRSSYQIKPQHVRLRLRINEEYKLQVSYSQAEDYPVDLYYLMDLSKSMEDDKEKLSALGDLLSATMRNITTNFKLGFGSFVDKVLMPYVSTIPKKLEHPCEGCEAPYGYRNHMQLSTNTDEFTMEVKRAAVSGNLDAPEGGFDAIMQAIACREQVGWREKARRLLVFSTDAGFHYAGDGKLGGVIAPNDGECHLNVDGLYTHSVVQDYPSISQINQKVKQNAINVIFAVTANQLSVYEKLSQHIEGSSSAKLSDDSSNVVDLVREEYSKITSTIEMKDNSTSHVAITYYSACMNGGAEIPTSKCEGLKVGDLVNFTAKIMVTSCPTDPNDWDQVIQIYPVGVGESLIINLKILCSCPCEQEGAEFFERKSPKCNKYGTYMCGICECDEQHFGKKCECSTADYHADKNKEMSCRPKDNSTLEECSGVGTCVCGQCDCPSSRYGPNCECDDFSCERRKQQLCSGPDHGTCVCKECKCKPGWTGIACDCWASNDTCYPPNGGEICSGHGDCECGECKCKSTEEGRYSGKYCEKCPTCSGRCQELKDCVQCQMYQTGPLKGDACANCTSFTPFPEKKIVINETLNEMLCMFYDEDDCKFVFKYSEVNGVLTVHAQEQRECPPKVFMLGIVLGVIAAIVLIGLAILLLWKLLTTIHDRREFARFEKERMNAKWDTGENPIYKQATSTFKNPTYAGK